MAQSHHRRRRTSKALKGSAAIPDRAFFRIGEVARLLGVAPYVLRFWETEFPTLEPEKGPNNQRRYRREDVERLLGIKHLLYERGYTIDGARRFLASRRRPEDEPDARPSEGERANLLARRIKHEVESLLADIEKIK
jgi:DNA-binding transcriptional MerR regulator